MNKELIARVEALLANPISPEPGNERTTPSQTVVREFTELVCDLADAAFTGDNPLDITIIDGSKHRAHTFFEENGIDFYDLSIPEADFMSAFAQANRTAASMISQGSEMLKRYSDIAYERARGIKKAEETKSDFDGLRKLLEEEKLVEFRAEADRLMEKYDPPLYAGTGEARKTPYNRSTQYRKLPEELQLLIDDYGLLFPAEVIEGHLAEINGLLDRAEPLVGRGHKANGGYEGSFDEAIDGARQALWRSQYLIGRRALQPVTVRYNRLANENRALTTLRDRGVNVVLEPAA